MRKLFETVVARCMKDGLGGEAFAVDASMIVADAHRRRGVGKVEDLDPASSRAVAEYLTVLDDAAFGGATPVEPKAISPTDPAARYTASANSARGGRARTDRGVGAGRVISPLQIAFTPPHPGVFHGRGRDAQQARHNPTIIHLS